MTTDSTGVLEERKNNNEILILAWFAFRYVSPSTVIARGEIIIPGRRFIFSVAFDEKFVTVFRQYGTVGFRYVRSRIVGSSDSCTTLLNNRHNAGGYNKIFNDI